MLCLQNLSSSKIDIYYLLGTNFMGNSSRSSHLTIRNTLNNQGKITDTSFFFLSLTFQTQPSLCSTIQPIFSFILQCQLCLQCLAILTWFIWTIWHGSDSLPKNSPYDCMNPWRNQKLYCTDKHYIQVLVVMVTQIGSLLTFPWSFWIGDRDLETFKPHWTDIPAI